MMLTGDNRHRRSHRRFARHRGAGELLPQDKQRIVRELQREGLKVAKVATAQRRTAARRRHRHRHGGGTDVALETRRGDPAWPGHGCRRMVGCRDGDGQYCQNITVALGLKVVFLVTTIAGITGLWPAILADTGATVLVTANAMRLLRWRG